MAAKYTFPFHLPKTYYRAIGEVAARWSLFELQVLMAIRDILRMDAKQGRILIQGMATRPRLAILKALANNWVTDGKLKKEIIAIVQESVKFANDRNGLAHGVWGYKSNKLALCLIHMHEPQHRWLPKAERITSQQILAKAQTILMLDKRLWRAIQALKASYTP